jgi:hypothetical protein
MLFDFLVNRKKSAIKFIIDRPFSGEHGSIQDRRKHKDRRSCTNPNLSGISRRVKITDRRGQTKAGELDPYLIG